MLLREFPRHSLKTRILLATLALFVVAIWSLSFYANRLLRDDITQLLGEQQRSTVAYVARQIEKEIGTRFKELEFIAAEIDSAALSRPEALQDHLERFHFVLQIFNAGIWVTEADGTTIVDVPRTAGRIGVNFKDRDYFQNALRNDRPSISPPLQGRVSGSPIIVIAVPLHDANGRIMGTLCGGTRLDLPNFLDPITENQHGKTGGFLLVSPEQRLIITATDASRTMEKLPPRGVNQAIDRNIDGYRGTQIQKGAKGAEVLVSTHSVPAAGWYVTAALPTDEAFAPIQDMRRSILMATLLLTFLSGAVVWWVLQRQLRPLESTADTLARMGKTAQKIAPLPVDRADEIGQLITAFNDLIQRLQKREQALQESEGRFKALHDASFGGISIHDKGVILDCNQGLVDMTGFRHEELIGMYGLRLIAPAWRRRVMQSILAGFDQPYEVEGLRKNGDIYPMTIRGKNIPYRGRQVRVTEFSDISAQKQAEQQQRIAAIAFESLEGMIVTDAKHRILRANQAFAEITGYPVDEIVGRTPRFLASGRHDASFFSAMTDALESDGRWQGEIWNRRKNGEIFPCRVVITGVRNEAGAITHYVGNIDDITRRKLAEEEISNLAFFDQLTGLPNRRLLADRLKQALTASSRQRRNGALLFIDLDNFKTLNDTLGHDQGDLLLQDVAQRLTACVREADTVARLGGDEFVVMLEALSGNLQDAASQAEAIGEKIIASLDRPYLLAGYEHHSSASIGVAMFQSNDDSPDELLKRADLAMYQAKSAGRNAMRFFDPKMQVVVSARAALEKGLREAVQKGLFALNYQPQVNSTRGVTGVEVLLRWRNPDNIQVPPNAFIPLAEETGLILPMGHWVLKTACENIATWASQPLLSSLHVAVNISARQFQQKNFVDLVLATLSSTGADPRHLRLELTESMLVHDMDEVITKMNALKAEGIGFSLDDFGTGYSSLTYLKRLPLDQLKIDRGFIRDILTDPDDAAIARMIVALGENFGLTVVAEGVESEAQLFKLAEQGCNFYQGYLFSRPLPLADFEAYVRG